MEVTLQLHDNDVFAGSTAAGLRAYGLDGTSRTLYTNADWEPKFARLPFVVDESGIFFSRDGLQHLPLAGAEPQTISSRGGVPVGTDAEYVYLIDDRLLQISKSTGRVQTVGSEEPLGIDPYEGARKRSHYRAGWFYREIFAETKNTTRVYRLKPDPVAPGATPMLFLEAPACGGLAIGEDALYCIGEDHFARFDLDGSPLPTLIKPTIDERGFSLRIVHATAARVLSVAFRPLDDEMFFVAHDIASGQVKIVGCAREEVTGTFPRDVVADGRVVVWTSSKGELFALWY